MWVPAYGTTRLGSMYGLINKLFLHPSITNPDDGSLYDAEDEGRPEHLLVAHLGVTALLLPSLPRLPPLLHRTCRVRRCLVRTAFPSWSQNRVLSRVASVRALIAPPVFLSPVAAFSRGKLPSRTT